jgi:hypothetical protein
MIPQVPHVLQLRTRARQGKMVSVAGNQGLKVVLGVAGVIAGSYLTQTLVRKRFFRPKAFTADNETYQRTLDAYREKIDADPITRRAAKKRNAAH